ncbi:hypothetical protein LR48_Vigan04g133500 [Vigna angularis]|uniref:Uncharacterized protein n=1 Tax=Phaseolus angularis TaxID=3914 RepID=A0A0L9UF03_PHAAN|nr:hypothetical protein LR48_Vigan04g133500 [Vigna angularis]
MEERASPPQRTPSSNPLQARVRLLQPRVLCHIIVSASLPLFQSCILITHIFTSKKPHLLGFLPLKCIIITISLYSISLFTDSPLHHLLITILGFSRVLSRLALNLEFRIHFAAYFFVEEASRRSGSCSCNFKPLLLGAASLSVVIRASVSSTRLR